jgi:hypothetical protein
MKYTFPFGRTVLDCRDYTTVTQPSRGVTRNSYLGEIEGQTTSISIWQAYFHPDTVQSQSS